MIKQVTNFIKLLNSDVKEEEIALGIILGMYAGFLSIVPFNFFLIFIFLILLKANISMFFLSFAIFKILSFGIDSLGNIIGYYVLKSKILFPFFVFLSSIPVIPFTEFNYTIICGDFIIALFLTPFIWVISIKFIKIYREKLKDKVQKFKIIQILNFSKFIEKK